MVSGLRYFNELRTWSVVDTGDISGAWTTWVPTVTASVGVITSYTVNSARYLQIGKLVFFHCDIKITDAGTGSGTLMVALPVTGAPYIQATIGQEISLIGKFIAGSIGLAGNTDDCVYFDNTSVIATGARTILGGTYEAA